MEKLHGSYPPRFNRNPHIRDIFDVGTSGNDYVITNDDHRPNLRIPLFEEKVHYALHKQFGKSARIEPTAYSTLRHC